MASKPIQFIFADKLNQRYDEIFNCEIDSTLSDTGFADPQKVMIKPSAGSEFLGQVGSPAIGKERDSIFFVDDDNVKTHYISKGGDVYRSLYSTPGVFLGKFTDAADIVDLTTGNDGDYYILYESLYVYFSGVPALSAYLWSGEYDNEADLFADFPTPEAGLFVFLKDTQSVYFSDNSLWYPLAENYAYSSIGLTNDVDYPAYFNTVTLPADWQVDSSASANATTTDVIKTNLATPTQYVGSYLQITSGTYKGKYAYILDYIAADSQFVLVSIGNATPILSGVTFSIFAKKGRYLQITNGKDDDVYFNGTSIETRLTGFVKQHISKFVDFPHGGPGIIRTFGNQCYTNVGDSVYISDVSQPLWFNINDSIDLQKNVAVDDFFVWKNKMISFGSNFTTFIDPNVSAGAERTIDFKNSGIVPGSCAQVLDDFWFLTYTGQIIPLSLTVYGTIYEKENIGFPVYRYLRTMQKNVTACFDGRRYYIYGEQKNEEGYTCVYDTFYKFWSVQTGNRPVKFIVDNGVVYFIEYGTGKFKKFTRNKVTNSEVPLDQYIISKDIDAGRVFTVKAMTDFSAFMENRNQDMYLKTMWRTNRDTYSKKYPIHINEKSVTEQNGVLGHDNIDDITQVQHYSHISFGNDMANIWKWGIWNSGTNGFYINQVEFGFTFPPNVDVSNVDL